MYGRMWGNMVRVLHYIGGLGFGGSQMFVMGLYRNIDREKIQFDFNNSSNMSSSENVLPISQQWFGDEPASDEYWASLMVETVEESTNL